MKKPKQYLTLTLILALCMTVLAGCGRRNNNDDATADPTMTPNVQEDVIGIINYVSDASIAVTEYESDTDLRDLASLDLSALNPTDTTRYIPIDEDTKYYFAVGAGTTEARRDDLAVGDLIAAVTDENGILTITRLETEDADTNGTNGTTNTDDTNNTGSTGNGNTAGGADGGSGENSGTGTTDTPEA